MKTLLIVTVGHSDVQLVKDEWQHKFDGNTCGTIHDAIRERSWSVVNKPRNRSRDIVKIFRVDEEHQSGGRAVLGIEGKPKVAPVGEGDQSVRTMESRRTVDVLPDGEVELCTPKVDSVLAHFRDALPTSALIFETNRENARDPHLAGEVVERRLRDRGVKQVTRVAFLTGTEELEDMSNDVDAVVRQAVVATLSDAIRQQLEQLTRNDQVVVATTGGLPAANELINELVRLHAVGGPTVTALEVPDVNRSNQEERAVAERFHPAAGYRARWHALSLVEKGNLLGAWGAVSHLKGVPGQEWTQVIEWLAQFASSLPLSPECRLAVLDHRRKAARSALRVELALRAGDIPRAVHGTCQFLESALWDHLLDHFDQTGNRVGKSEVLLLKPGTLQPTGRKLLRNAERDEKERMHCPFEYREDGTYLFFEEGAGRFARDYVKSEPLKKLNDVVVRHVKPLRNDVAHNEPTQALMQEAERRMQRVSLWSERDDFGTVSFLSQELIQQVLRELGEHSPGELFNRLFEEVRSRLCAARF